MQLSCYTDRLLFEGIYKQEKFVTEHEDGCGLICLSSEQIENMIAMIKKFSICKNTGKNDCFCLMCKFADLYCVGSVMKDQIDFTRVLKQLSNIKLLIYDPIETPRIFQECEEKMPTLMLKMIKELRKMKLGDPLPAIIQRIYNHGDISVHEMSHAEANAFNDAESGFIHDDFYVTT